jgi:hypothetical protein
MSYSGARTVIQTHMAATGTALNPAIRNVKPGAPMRIAERMGRHWWTGDGDSDLIPQTLTDATGVERLALAWYWPIGDGSEAVAEEIDRQAHALAADLRNRLEGDDELGGNVASSTLGDFSMEYLETTGGWVGALFATIDLHYIDTDTIAD